MPCPAGSPESGEIRSIYPPENPLTGAVIPSFDPLINAAVKPLSENAEQQLAVSGMLRECADPAHPGAAATIARWEQMDAKKRPEAWKAILYAAAAVAFLAFVAIGISMYQNIRIIRAISSFDPVHASLPEGLGPAERLLLGDPKKSPLAQKEALHLSDPERPDFYAEYTAAYHQENVRLPSSYLETVARIDPENSFFLYAAAGRIGGESVTKPASKGTGARRMRDGVELPAIPAETEWEIADEAGFKEAMELIEKASALPRFDTYETAMAEKRVALFDQDKFAGRIHALANSASQVSQTVPLMKMANVIQASAYLHSVAGDAEGFRKDHELAGAMLEQIGNGPPANLVGELVFAAIAESTTRSLHQGAIRLGLDDLSESLGKRNAAFQEYRDLRMIRQRKSDDALVGLVEKEGSTMHRLTLPVVGRQLAGPPALRSEDLADGRLADHNLASAVAASLVFVSVLLAGICAFLFQFRAPQPIRVMDGRFAQLINARDWAWILGAGVALPFALILCISVLTPLGGRSIGLPPMGFLFPSIHYTVLLLFLLTLPPLLIHWRMTKRSGAFSLGFKAGRLPIAFAALGVLMALAAFPLVDWKIVRGDSIFMLLGGLLGLWQLYILIGALRALFGKKAHRLRRAIVARAMLPALALAMIIPVAALPFFLLSAQHRMTRDELTRVDARGFSRFEAEVADLKRKEINAILGQ